MIIKCSKEVDLIAFEIIGELEKECTRVDISDFLKERLDSNNSIDIKVKENFLIPLGLIDENYQLTEKGEKCIESEKVWLKEKGEYTLFEIDDDIFRVIVDIEPSSNLKSLSELNEKRLTKQEIVSIKNKNKKYRTLRDETFFYEMKNFKKHLKINYEIDMKDNSNFYIEDMNYGIEDKKTTIEFNEIKIPYISILKSLEKTDEFLWNEEMNAIEISYNFAHRHGENNYSIEKLNFEKEDFETKEFHFDRISLNGVKVMPNNESEAINWYFHRIKNLLKKDYIKISDFNIINQEEVNCEFLKYYNTEILKINDLLEDLKYTDEYWNLKAPLDLSFEN